MCEDNVIEGLLLFYYHDTRTKLLVKITGEAEHYLLQTN